MKQCLGLCLTLLLPSSLFLICQVQGGIITNQQSLTLPAELAEAITSSSSTSSSSSSTSVSSDKNETSGARTGRVIYTAPYSNVRVASKQPKNLKYFPIPAVVSKKTPANIVPILPKFSDTTTSTSTSTTTTSTTTSTTPESEPLPQEVESEKDLEALVQVEQTVPDIIEIMEEIQRTNGNDDDLGDEVVTETVRLEGSEPDSETVTESNFDL